MTLSFKAKLPSGQVENVCSKNARGRDASGENSGHMFVSVCGFFLFLPIYLSIAKPAQTALMTFVLTYVFKYLIR